MSEEGGVRGGSGAPTIFGIRHHGPGCARALLAALEALAPDIILVEGPPDAQAVVALATHAAMQPPVALLVYAPEAPRLAAFYPFTNYSPEWQALRFALERSLPVRFIDLPLALQFAARLAAERQPAEGATEHAPLDGGAGRPAAEEAIVAEAAGTPNPDPVPAGADSQASRFTVQDDPIGALAEAAGYHDHELWWEHQIEERRDARDLFAAIMEAMAALRALAPPAEGIEAQREASMRQAIRTAQRDGYRRIAVICGAWHAPALATLGPATVDAALLAGGGRLKVQATWIPWTNSRLASRSGYGAGVVSPGWYEHLWTAPDRVTIRWVSKAARLLRAEDLDASASNVIEAVRLAEALAALRGRPSPGLAELREAVQTVLCGGETLPMQLIRERLEVGEALGAVPDETPTVPLQQDLTAQQRRLRLPPSAEVRPLDLDLRTEIDRARSQLLHRLNALGIPWGRRQPVHGKAGTFHEVWQVQWQPEFAVALIEGNVWGNRIDVAAASRLRHLGGETEELPRLTELLTLAMLADLPEAVTALLATVEERAAHAADIRHLLEALPPLAQVARYGDVRGTAATQVLPVMDRMLARATIGLPNACHSLDDAAAEAMARSIGGAQESVDLLDRPEWRRDWHGALRALLQRDAIHALVRGWAARLLYEGQALEQAELERLARLALSPALPAAQAAAWLQGILRGSGLLLLHADGLWAALDKWLGGLSTEGFVELLPLVRRGFAGFQPAERQAMGEKVLRLGSGGSGKRPSDLESPGGIDRRRADQTLPVLAHILGGSSRAN